MNEAPSPNTAKNGILYVVATPIGNLGDLTYRAVETLRMCDVVLAEDTRRTQKLLSHLGIAKPLRAVHAHVEHGQKDKLVDELLTGRTFVLVSDAGTPMVSDPGEHLVRAAIARGVVVVPIPGASAVLTALMASGLAEGGFRFLGFLPRSGSERAEALARCVATEEPVVLFEAGNRTKSTLSELALRMPERLACVGRELTKLHETFTRGSLASLAESTPDDLLGEVTLVLGRRELVNETFDQTQIDKRIDEELAAGASGKTVADIVAAWSGLARRDVYARVVARKAGRS